MIPTRLGRALGVLAAISFLTISPADAKDPRIRSIGSLAGLRAIKYAPLTDARLDGEMAVVTDCGSGARCFYRFDKSSTATETAQSVIKPTDGIGRWLLIAPSSAAGLISGLSSSTPVAITSTAAVGTGTTVARADHAHAHGVVTTGANSHDADQVDFELLDGSKLVVGAGSDTVEAALTDLDAAFGAALSTLSTASKLVVGAINEVYATAAAAVPKATYDANTVLAATADNTPLAITMAASTILGRGPTGDIVAIAMGVGLTMTNTEIGIVGALVTNGGAGNSGLPLLLDAQGKAAGRVLETDGAKLDGIEALADVTDFTNVSAALAAASGEVSFNSQNIGTVGTVDGVDISARDAILTTTTATADAALPKGGGQITGNITCAAAETFDGVDVSTLPGLITTAQTTADNALPKAGGQMVGNITFSAAQTVDGRDVSADGAQLDTAYLARVQKVTKQTSLAGLGASPVNVAFDAALPAGGVPLFATMLVTTKGTVGAGGSYIKVSVGGDGGAGNPAISTVMGQMNVESGQAYPNGTTLRGSNGTLLGWVPAETPQINIEYDGAAPTAGDVTISLYYVVLP